MYAHYKNSLAIQFGMAIAKNTSLAEAYDKESEDVDELLDEWTDEFIASDADDSWEFFQERIDAWIDEHSDAPQTSVSPDISLREYIANAEVLEEGKTCPSELVDEAMNWILNGHNDLLERLDGIVSEAVHHAMTARDCPYCIDNDCELSCEDNPCTGTAAEQSICAYRS